jgi:hypothetical protein
MTTPEDALDLASKVSRRVRIAGVRIFSSSAAVAMCIAVGKVSLDDWLWFTSSFGWIGFFDSNLDSYRKCPRARSSGKNGRYAGTFSIRALEVSRWRAPGSPVRRSSGLMGLNWCAECGTRRLQRTDRPFAEHHPKNELFEARPATLRWWWKGGPNTLLEKSWAKKWAK